MVMSFLLNCEPMAVGTGPGLAHSDPRLQTQCLVCESRLVGVGEEGAIRQGSGHCRGLPASLCSGRYPTLRPLPLKHSSCHIASLCQNFPRVPISCSMQSTPPFQPSTTWVLAAFPNSLFPVASVLALLLEGGT